MTLIACHLCVWSVCVRACVYLHSPFICWQQCQGFLVPVSAEPVQTSVTQVSFPGWPFRLCPVEKMFGVFALRSSAAWEARAGWGSDWFKTTQRPLSIKLLNTHIEQPNVTKTCATSSKRHIVSCVLRPWVWICCPFQRNRARRKPLIEMDGFYAKEPKYSPITVHFKDYGEMDACSGFNAIWMNS